MNIQLNFKCLLFVTILIGVLMTSVFFKLSKGKENNSPIIKTYSSSAQSTKNRYILPVLPETHYTLNDVIVLPESTDDVEVAIISMNTSIELASFNLTGEHEFRLGYGTDVQMISVQTGLQIITSCKTNVILDLPGGLLKLPSFSESGCIYRIFPITDNSGKTVGGPLVIQSIIPYTSVSVCGIQDNDEMKLDQKAPGNNKSDNCATLSTSNVGRYLLNVTAGHLSIQITSEHPINIFQGESKLSSGSVGNKQIYTRQRTTSKSSFSETIWHVIPASSNLTTTAVLVPSDLKREYTFSTVCSMNCSIGFKSSDDHLITVNITENKPIDTRLNIPPGDILTITKEPELSLNCVNSNYTFCNDELILINMDSMVNVSNSKTDNDRTEYMWIYISNKTSLFILFPNNTDFIVTSVDGNIIAFDSVQFNISNSFLKLASLSRLCDGLYTISTNGTIDSCFLIYAPKKHVVEPKDTFNEEASEYKLTYSSGLTTSFAGMIENDYSTSVSSIGVQENAPEIAAEADARTSPYPSIAKDTTSSSHSASLLHFEGNYKEASSTVLSKHIAKFSKENKLLTQTASGQSGDYTKANSTNKIITDWNSRFKAVVDIFHSNGGRQDILIDKSNARENPTYTYRVNINGNYRQEGDGKSPFAIIASLVSAILAVGAIILIFLLKDFFSRRQIIRKTRIRPFISHC